MASHRTHHPPPRPRLLAWAKKSKVNAAVRLENQQPMSIPLLTHDQRLQWIKELLTGDAESLHYGVAGILLLLYAQPLVKVAALPTTAIVVTAGEIRISLGAEPVPVPEPFASMLKDHLHNRPNLRTAGGIAANPWLSPSRHPGKHMHTRSIVNRLGEVGINVLGARNSALRNLVAETPLRSSPSFWGSVTPAPSATPSWRLNHGRVTSRADRGRRNG